VTVETDPEPVEILGRSCRHVTYFEDGVVRVEEWTCDEVSMPCDLTEVKALTGDFSRELLGRLRGRRGFGLKTKVTGRLPTLPRLTETEVVSLRTPEELDPALFELPAGCRKVVPGARGR
jgi:hypothetical protein